MSSWNDAISWVVVLLIVIGTFMAVIRILRWYRSVHGQDPLEPEEYPATRYSLRRDR